MESDNPDARSFRLDPESVTELRGIWPWILGATILGVGLALRWLGYEIFRYVEIAAAGLLVARAATGGVRKKFGERYPGARALPLLVLAFAVMAVGGVYAKVFPGPPGALDPAAIWAPAAVVLLGLFIWLNRKNPNVFK